MSQADFLTPPLESNIIVVATVANTASAALDLHDTAGVNGGGGFVTVTCDDGAGNAVAFYYTTSPLTGMAAPDPTAVAGTGRTFPAFNSRADFISTKASRFLRIYPKGAGFYRVYASSPKE